MDIIAILQKNLCKTIYRKCDKYGAEIWVEHKQNIKRIIFGVFWSKKITNGRMMCGDTWSLRRELDTIWDQGKGNEQGTVEEVCDENDRHGIKTGRRDKERERKRRIIEAKPLKRHLSIFCSILELHFEEAFILKIAQRVKKCNKYKPSNNQKLN